MVLADPGSCARLPGNSDLLNEASIGGLQAHARQVSNSVQHTRKQRGAYYTPPILCEYLAEWAIRDSGSLVLEPSAGDGEFIRAAATRLGSCGRIVAVELHSNEAKKAASQGQANTRVLDRDFFAWFEEERPYGRFDVVLGNPPFIRYQSFREEQRQPAFRLMRAEGLRPSRLTNAWVPFVVLATCALRAGGRLALVLPAELLQVGYAAELRQYLARKYKELQIVSFKRIVFSGIEEETILLLGVRGDTEASKISMIELENLGDLQTSAPRKNSPTLSLDHASEKWTRFYLTPAQLDFVRELDQSNVFTKLGELASVDVGVVTGRNDFFVLTPGQADARGLAESCLPLVGRSAQIPGLVLEAKEWFGLATIDSKCLLLQLGAIDRTRLSRAALSYVEDAELRQLHEGYKCRIRLPRWWNVPAVWSPDAFLLRQIHDAPRLVLNAAGATCTDTLHRISVKDGVNPKWLVAACVNSLSLAFAELRGRSYGGGVLELEPTEAEALPFPRPTVANQDLPLETFDKLVREREITTILDQTDRLLLRAVGLDQHDTRMLRAIWEKLSSRRRNRKRASP